MSDFDVKERRFEEDIEDYLIHHGGYKKGNPATFNRVRMKAPLLILLRILSQSSGRDL